MKKGAHAAATVGLPLRTLPCLPGWLHSFKLRCQQNDSLAKRRDLQNGLWALDHARARDVTPCRAGGTEWFPAVGNGAGRRYTQLRI